MVIRESAIRNCHWAWSGTRSGRSERRLRNRGLGPKVWFLAERIFRGFLFLCCRISSRILSQDFSPQLCAKKCTEKSSRKIPGKILQNLYSKTPRQPPAEGPAPNQKAPRLRKASDHCQEIREMLGGCVVRYAVLSALSSRPTSASFGLASWSICFAFSG